jgi:large subunit ribosomal protein L13
MVVSKLLLNLYKYMQKTHTIDATGKKLGRLATEVATLLMGKDSPTFRKHFAPTAKVTITNASKLNATQTRLEGILHTRYSGYPGGITQMTAKRVADTKGYGEVIKHAVSRMLPKNKHRDTMLLNLSISE